jgi:hypothetical protein
LSWAQRFKWRHGIKRQTLHGEAGSVEKQSVAHHRRLLQELLDEYDPADVYNFEETSLFFRRKPSQTLATKKMHGKKKDKTRITIALYCNMDGSAKKRLSSSTTLENLEFLGSRRHVFMPIKQHG